MSPIIQKEFRKIQNLAHGKRNLRKALSSVKLLTPIIILVSAVFAMTTFVSPVAWGEDWVFYGGSGEGNNSGPAIRDWYMSNRLKVLSQTEAKTYHYYDRDSVAANSPFPGGIVRVWEKVVFQEETKTYDEAMEEVTMEQERKLKRKLGVLDTTWTFPLAVKRATKEITTLYEINCDTREFYIMEVNSYDKTGDRMTRETAFDKDLWPPIKQQTLMEALSRIVCN